MAKPKPSIAVSEARGVRTLHVGGETIQSSMRLEDPCALALDYTRCRPATRLERAFAGAVVAELIIAP